MGGINSIKSGFHHYFLIKAHLLGVGYREKIVRSIFCNMLDVNISERDFLQNFVKIVTVPVTKINSAQVHR